MVRSAASWCCLVSLLVSLSAAAVFAETVELVTYYPAPAGSEAHVTSLTVGTAYQNEAPADGQVFISDRVGIGAGFSAAQPPTQALEVIGNLLANSPGTALFIADRGAAGNFSGLQLLTAGTLQWTIGSRNNGTEHLHFFSDADNVTRLFIQQGTGNVGIGTTTPQGAAAPNGQTTGNLDVNDVWLRAANSGTGGWASTGGGVGAQSLAENGYAKIGGMLLQWGRRGVSSGEGTFTVNFPIAFAQVFNIQATVVNGPTWGIANDTWAQVVSFTTTRATLAVQGSYGGSNEATDVYWMAIGR